MKKILFLGAMAAMLLGTASCSSDMEPSMGGEVPVSFAINLGDDIDSRTISDGLKANTLKFAVFENGTEITALAKEVPVADKKATVTTRLVKGHTYSFVFWAQNSACTAYNTTDMKAIKVDYAANCNDETRDAFYKMDSFTVTQAFEKTEVLTRPFAQINFLASDAAGVVGVDAYKSMVTVTGVPTTLNTLDGTVAGSTDVTFDYATIPNETLAGYESYKYVAMNYILAATDKEVKNEVVLTVNDGTQDVNTVTVANCPVQRNYRTNIFGSLFTVDGKFNIIIDPIYNTPDYEVDLDATYYEANTSGALEDIIAQINNDQPAKAIIKVADGVTLTWQTGASHGSTPLLDETNTKTQQLVFEGEGTATFEAQGAGVGPIRTTNGATIVFNNMTIVDNSVSYAETAWEFGYLEFSGSLKFNNCTIKDAISVEGTTNNNNTDVDAEFVGCKFISNTETTTANPKPSSMYAVWISGGNSKFTNCEFTGYRGPKIHEAYGSDVAAVYFDGCNFHDITGKPGIAIGTLNAPTIVSIKNSTFKNCQPGDQGLYKYESDTDVSTFNFTDENNTVINE